MPAGRSAQAQDLGQKTLVPHLVKTDLNALVQPSALMRLQRQQQSASTLGIAQ
jgi:hypothetical protein